MSLSSDNSTFCHQEKLSFQLLLRIMNTELSSVGIDLGTTNSEIYKYVDKYPVAYCRTYWKALDGIEDCCGSKEY